MLVVLALLIEYLLVVVEDLVVFDAVPRINAE